MSYVLWISCILLRWTHKSLWHPRKEQFYVILLMGIWNRHYRNNLQQGNKLLQFQGNEHKMGVCSWYLFVQHHIRTYPLFILERWQDHIYMRLQSHSLWICPLCLEIPPNNNYSTASNTFSVFTFAQSCYIS